jgi:hypothetical protein
MKNINSADNNYAFIDGANLHKGIRELVWCLDYKRFRIWLKEKYNVIVDLIVHFLSFQFV